MASLEEIRDGRIQKLEGLRTLGIDPYPVDSKQDYTLEIVHKDFAKLSKLKKKSIHLVGRVFSVRGQGALAFVDFSDGTAMFQAVLKKDETLDEEFIRFRSFVDIGDFVEFEGTLFTTQTKQKSLLVKKWKMLAKSLRPLPEKWHGLQDVEERFRRRYLDVLMSQEVRDRFIVRSKVITEMRRILDDAGYLEVETPALQPLAGGASAKPFVTHHNALDIDMYLRISPELYLKRMLVSGLPKVYEIARDFRNEGIDATHNPEFTMVEYYEAYSTAEKQMVFTEKLLKTIIKNVFKTTAITFDGNVIDFSKPFTVVSYLDLLRTYALITDPETITLEELTLKASQLGVKVDKGDSIAKILDNIYKKTCRPKIIQPTFIIDYPADYLPLAKRHPKNKELVDAFQLVIGSIELVKAFSELNDPIDQKDRLVKESDKQKGGDDEAQNDDQDFIEALEYGMPPAGGVGIGIDRLVMFLTDTHNIKEVIFFPTMRPRE